MRFKCLSSDKFVTFLNSSNSSKSPYDNTENVFNTRLTTGIILWSTPGISLLIISITQVMIIIICGIFVVIFNFYILVIIYLGYLNTKNCILYNLKNYSQKYDIDMYVGMYIMYPNAVISINFNYYNFSFSFLLLKFT